ncbi:hypothetical protein HDU67_007956 [Dinochytrium kinnereticum]|nr:hypothetical protein HDU67_007956 [Dinochytrium kinnereticum]
MIAPSSILTAAVTLALSITSASAALQGLPCTPRAYTGTLCKDFSTSYATSSVLVGQNRSEDIVSTYLTQVNLISKAPVCYDKLYAIACGLEFPKCNAAGGASSGVTEVVCESTCRDALTTCIPIVQKELGQGIADLLVSSLHNCSFLTTSNPEPYGKPGECLDIKRVGASTPAPAAPKCNPPFLPRTSNVTNKNCIGDCCVPCPVQDWIYPANQFNTAVVLSRIASGISALLVGYVVLSWAVLPGRRQHPGDIVLHFAIAVMIWQSCALFLLGNPRRIQCADSVTVSTASNNLLCGIQGALLMCSVHASVFWAGYMIANLHATIVWRSNLFERYKPLGVTLCWGLPGIFTFLPFLISNVDAVTGLTCLISSKDANKLFFSVHAVVVLPSFFLNLGTMIHIMVVARRSSSNNMSGGYSSNGYSGNGNSYGGEKPLSARRQMLQLLKLNWRALFLGVVFIVTYVTYVIFYQVVVTPLANADSGSQWIQEWAACLTRTNDQNLCHERFKSNIPSFALIIVSACLVSSVGLWLFIIFGFNLQILYDWVNWFHDTCSSRRGKQQRQDEPEWR